MIRLEVQGDLISRIIWVIVIGVTNLTYLLSPPDPPSTYCGDYIGACLWELPPLKGGLG